MCGAFPYLPEALGGIFSARALEDLGAARVLGEELGHIVDGAIDNDPEPFFFGLVLGDLSGCVLFRHLWGRWLEARQSWGWLLAGEKSGGVLTQRIDDCVSRSGRKENRL